MKGIGIYLFFVYVEKCMLPGGKCEKDEKKCLTF